MLRSTTSCAFTVSRNRAMLGAFPASLSAGLFSTYLICKLCISGRSGVMPNLLE